eukprot:COSAG01_NODE_44644_length_417_cov_0.544025_1_plen_84_part_00
MAHQDAEAVAPGGLRGQFEQDGEWVQDWERAVGEMLVTQVGIHPPAGKPPCLGGTFDDMAPLAWTGDGATAAAPTVLASQACA